MTMQSQLQQLAGYINHDNPDIAEYAQAVTNYAHALEQGKLSSEEYHGLIGDIDVLKRMARTAEEQQQVASIYSISRTILSLL